MEIVLNKQLNTQILIDKYLLNIKKENPIEIFKNIFNLWKENNNYYYFKLLIASPYINKNLWKGGEGGHVNITLLEEIIDKRKDNDKDIQNIFIGNNINSFCRPPFIINCTDNSFYCHLCKVNLNINFKKRRKKN